MANLDPAMFMANFKDKRITVEIIKQSRNKLIQKTAGETCNNPDYGLFKYSVHLFPDNKQMNLLGIVNPPIAIIPDQGPFAGTAAQRQNHERQQAQHKEQAKVIKNINACIFWAFGTTRFAGL